MALAFRFVTFLSDYGLEDEFVGVCHGVIKRFAPEVEILDISHGIPPQDVPAGGTVLAQAVRYMPPAVHLAVVDPGVGTRRRAIVVGTAKGPPLIGPDNGLLFLAAKELGGITRVHSIEDEALFLDRTSKTFHGRDVFAPVAARLALGMPPENVGPELDPGEIVQLELPVAQVHDDHIHARIVQVDHFGNLQLSADSEDLGSIGVLPGDQVEIRIGGRSYAVEVGRAFSEVAGGKLVLVEDSHRAVALAVFKGHAGRVLEAHRGDPVVVARLPVGA